MKSFLATTVRFPLPEKSAPDTVAAVLREIATLPVPGLVRRQSWISESGRHGGFLFLWTDRTTALAFLSRRLAPVIFRQFGIEPVVRMHEMPAAARAGI